jgi:hypothetical protein
MAAKFFQDDTAEDLVTGYSALASAAALGEVFYADEVELLSKTRQAIDDRGVDPLTNDELRNADVNVIDSLESLLTDFLADKRAFADLSPFSIDESDLTNWWFRLNEILAGSIDTEDLPEYLKDAATKHSTARA